MDPENSKARPLSGCLSIFNEETGGMVSVIMSTLTEGPWEDTMCIKSRQEGTGSSHLAEESIAGWSG